LAAVAASLTLNRQRNLILAVLLALATAAWGLVVWQAISGVGMSAGAGSASVLTTGMAIPLFLGMWIAMMAAMMFPTAAPMMLIFARVQAGRRSSGRPYVPTAFFTASYLLVWTAAGAAAFGAAYGIGTLADHVMWLHDDGPRIAGGTLILAGVYQLTPLKSVCLRHCRSPMAFVIDHWRDGRRGAVLMGLQHGGFCLGCCWLLFVLLFPLGVMNLAAMGVLTVLIFLEKTTPWGARIAQVLGIALIAYGVAVVSAPVLLPGAPGMTGPGMGGMSG